MLKRWFPGLTGFAFTVGQLVFFLLAAPGGSLRERYHNAIQWDVRILADIAWRGYQSTVPPTGDYHISNVSHFPGFPAAAAAVSAVTGIDTQLACVLASQFFALLFWTYACLLLLDWGFSRRAAMATLLFTASFPFCFFLVTGLSESMFLAGALGLLVWDRRGRPGLAALHGFGLSCSRITGAALSLAPLLSERPRGREPRRKLITAAASFAAPAIFFLYCQLRFHDWRLYQETQLLGWGSRANFLGVFYPDAYSFFLPPIFDYIQVGLFLRSWLTAGLFTLLGLELLRSPRHPERIAALLAACAVWYLTFAGQFYANYRPIARHYLPCFVLLYFVGAARAREAFARGRWTPAFRMAALAGAGLFAVGCFLLQFSYTSIYAHGGMVF